MNITNFIVEVLRKGQQVEVPGIGTFSLQTVDAYHDEQSGVLYPKRESVSFSTSTTGNVDIIDAIAKSECVSQETAKMMWNSFVSAVDERLRTTGSHNFKGLGTLVRCADGYAFQPDPSLNFAEDAAKPLHDINVYNHAEEDDPFAVFEQPLHPIEPEVIVTAPVDVPLDKFEPTQEDTPALTDEPQQEEAHSEPVEPSPIKVAPIIPDDFYKPMEPVDVDDATQSESQQELEQESATESNNTEGDESNNDDLNVFKGIPDSDGSSNPIDSMDVGNAKPKKKKKHTWLWILLALVLLLAGVASYFYFVYRPSHGGTMDTAMEALKKDIASIRGEGSEIASNEDEDIDGDVTDVNGITAGGESTGVGAEGEGMEGGIGGGTGEGVEGGVGAGGVASTGAPDDETVATSEEQTANDAPKNTAAQETAEAQKPADESENANQENDASAADGENVEADGQAADAPFDFNRHVTITSFNLDLVELDANDVDASANVVCKKMASYVSDFLASRRYTNSRQQMMQRIDQYSRQRLEELYGVTYTPYRFYPSGSDYVKDYCYDFLKSRRRIRGESQVVEELLDNDMLEKLLGELVSELGLQADPLPVPPAPPVTFKKMAEPTASFETKSRRGYDIVAGFYTNKNTANRMASILKRQGCDAYIIDHNGLYYVSMGSAPTQTAAESLYKHIKSWYDGDVAIRKL